MGKSKKESENCLRSERIGGALQNCREFYQMLKNEERLRKILKNLRRFGKSLRIFAGIS